LSRGWIHPEPVNLLSIRDEPAFRSLRGHPRFEAVASKIEAHMARERRETVALHL
jgi:hypothetical protein